MMFAVTVGEIGLQVATLVQARHFRHYLPAYSHLLLATIVVAASWVGWSRSVIPGARKDVQEIFEWPFVVLLLDMFMVVTYFILVRTVDFENDHCRVDPAWLVARWHVAIFALYLAWDVVTKVLMYERQAGISWWRGIRRMVPTAICLGISCYLWWWGFAHATDERLLAADFALLSVVLLFRAMKGLEKAQWPDPTSNKPRRRPFWIAWTVACCAGFGIGMWATLSSTLWGWLHFGFGIVQAIRNPIS